MKHRQQHFFPKEPSSNAGPPPPWNEPHPSGIHLLPPELLQTVFYEASGSSGDYQGLFSIRRVCKYWKELIDGTPILWETVTSALDQNLLAMILRNSGTQPLYVLHNSNNKANFKVFINLITQSAERWRQLECCSRDRSEHEQLLSLPLCKLHSLKIAGAIGTSYKHPLDAPGLTTLDVWGFSLNWTTLSGLHSLALGKTPGPSTAELFKILKESPQLESLILSETRPVYTTGHPEPSPSQVLLSRLNTMSLLGLPAQPLTYILDKIEAPNLQIFQVKIWGDHDPEDRTHAMQSVRRHIGAYRPLQDGMPVETSVHVSYRRLHIIIGGLGVQYWGPGWTEGNDLPEKLSHFSGVMEQMDPTLCQEVRVLALEGGGDGEIAKYLPILHGRFPQIEELVVRDIILGGADSRAICGQLSWPSQSGGAGEWLFPKLTRLRFEPAVELVYDRILPLLDVRRAEEQTKTITELRVTGGTISSQIAQALQNSVEVLDLTGVEIVEERTQSVSALEED